MRRRIARREPNKNEETTTTLIANFAALGYPVQIEQHYVQRREESMM